MKGNLGNLMKQAQKMQENLQKAQQEIGNLEVIGESGGASVLKHSTNRPFGTAVTSDAASSVVA